MTRAPARERLIVALDLPRLDAALALVAQLEGAVDRFKVGLELFTAAGPRAVAAVRERGGRVFLDLKLHDIPETVRRAAAAAAHTGAEILTVHAAGGAAMLAAAVAGAGEAGAVGVYAITVLTSLDLAALAETGTSPSTIEALVLRRAQLAARAGCAGVIASPHEARGLRAALPAGFGIITPGVRAAGAAAADQRRVASARDAIREGADAVVVGRPIRDAADPRAAALALLAELAA